MRGLYAILDLETVEREKLAFDPFARALLAGRPAALQLRAKHRAQEEIAHLLGRLRDLKRTTPNARETKLICNDHWELAARGLADAAHVGQSDASVSFIRAQAPSLALGLSTHSLAELDRALLERPAYVALGPIFETRTKANPEPPVGLPVLEEAYVHACRAGVPLVAIGGIDEERAAQLVGRCDAVAIVSALASSDYEDVTSRALRIRAMFEGA